MKQIAFKNFRKFKDFAPIDFAPITILVGENNAGKSTVVKAILSILDFIETRIMFNNITDSKEILKQYFYFNNSYFAHIGTFKRALCNKSDESSIEFSITASDYKITLRISGDANDEEAIRGRIESLKLVLLKINVEINYDLMADKLYVELHKPDLRNIDTINSEYRQYYDSIPETASISTSITSQQFTIGGTLLDLLFNKYIEAIEEIAENGNRDYIYGRYKCNEATRCFIQNNKQTLTLGAKSSPFPLFLIYSFKENIDYIYAHAVTQTVIYNAKDKNDYFVKTIHEFASLRVEDNSRAKKFIHKWMKEFKIGQNYEIKSVGGEAHIVLINSLDGSSVNLADKGMGSIRLMILLFRLATKIHQTSIGFESNKNVTIIIEEPEQNLHPTLQSKLANLFYELNRNYGFNFLIETHSEYFIRKTQLIVKENFDTEDKLQKCPFKVYYFPSSGNPYAMVYRQSGIFDNSFGPGFFDEASNLAFDLF